MAGGVSSTFDLSVSSGERDQDSQRPCHDRIDSCTDELDPRRGRRDWQGNRGGRGEEGGRKGELELPPSLPSVLFLLKRP